MEQKINILRVITWLPVGGIERRLVAVLPRLDRERFNVSLVCIRERGPLADELEAAGVPVYEIPFRSRWDPAGLRKLAALMCDKKIDIVHSHMYRANVPATVAARIAGVKNVWCQVHNVGTWETRRQAWMDRMLCRWRSGMIAVSERVRQDVMDRLGLPHGRVKVIYNGVDLARFRSARARREEIRSREGAAEGDVVFLFAARLVEQKRCVDFLDALGEIQAREAGARSKAWILGDGPQRAEMEEHAAKLPFAQNVRFFGKRADVEDFMAGADVFVLPSTKEGFSNALIEAMASGLPIVATDVGGNAEAVTDSKEGLIIPPVNVELLADAMRKLQVSEETRKRMAEAAGTRAEMFSIERMIGEIEKLYMRDYERVTRR